MMAATSPHNQIAYEAKMIHITYRPTIIASPREHFEKPRRVSIINTCEREATPT